MNKANECTCPSGDGSLVHPCPAHPAVEQAGGDRWDALQSIMEWTASENIPDERKLCLIRNAARAALAQPSPKCATCNDSGQIVVSGPHYQGEFQPPEYETEPCDMCAQPSPAQAEQAEAERPEVAGVAFVLRNIGAMDAEDIDGDNVDLRFEDAEGRDTGCDVSIVEYAEKAADLLEQQDRIVGELRADRDSWAEQAEQRLADWDEMRKERDAALARVEQQERTIAGMNEAHAKLAGLYEAAQAQHSVPEGWKLVPVEPTEDVLEAIHNGGYVGDDQELRWFYQSILAAAPAPGGE
ncbi:hypothetical protein NMF55_00455 [Pseudomonas aeruginosa]|nr:hypothetical protein [Pseudomonas aeruginosa]